MKILFQILIAAFVGILIARYLKAAAGLKQAQTFPVDASVSPVSSLLVNGQEESDDEYIEADPLELFDVNQLAYPDDFSGDD